ncbi:MAG: hypothetical protein Q7N50_15685 [Armatimonadota bacterium]|nr:hypothetical protein [Armatimonadota bacterium]
MAVVRTQRPDGVFTDLQMDEYGRLKVDFAIKAGVASPSVGHDFKCAETGDLLVAVEG